MILKYADASAPLQLHQRLNWHQEIARFKTTCKDVMTNAVNQAKSKQEIQIDYLAQVALVKRLIEKINDQYEEAVQHFKSVVRKQEVSRRTESHLKLREEVSGIIQRRNAILQDVSTELFTYFIEARREVDELRELNFGDDGLLPEELFYNPLLQTAFRPDDYFMMAHYVLLGHRLEDPLNYNTLIATIETFFDRVRTETAASPVDADDEFQKPLGYANGAHVSFDAKVDLLLKRLENMDCLFNYPETEKRVGEEKARKADRKHISELKRQAASQKKLLQLLYRIMKDEKLLAGIVAAYEIQPAIQYYCPPLKPQEVLQFAVVSKAKKGILRKIARFKKYSGKSMPIAGLKRVAADAKRVSDKKKKEHLIRFIKDFATYHRDLGNYYLFRETADCINLTEDDKIIRLSRENHTLYDFILEREQGTRKKPIINHVIIKADVRGSTGIIEQMKAQGLNPASNFSLNFFDPISHLIAVYGAEKVFIEGDAVIMSISEHEGTPEKWYGVARACGLAVNILMVVKRYNLQNRKNRLPRLDLGIGISFSPAAPTFFYDGNNPIMISPAINEADRLAECDRAVRLRFSGSRPPFNLQVYQIDTSGLEMAELLNSPMLRYNVMGIELSPAGFEKLAEEIHLTRFEARIPEIQPEPFTAYTGKFPTAAGNYQRIIIREADIPEISPGNFKIKRTTGRKYYEVCTNSRIYESVKQLK